MTKSWIKQKFDSELEYKYALQYKLVKNNDAFIIYTTFKPYRGLHSNIKYTPDFVTTNPLTWHEVKGWHPNIKTYLLKRKLILDFCSKNNIVFREVHYVNHKFIVSNF